VSQRYIEEANEQQRSARSQTLQLQGELVQMRNAELHALSEEHRWQMQWRLENVSMQWRAEFREHELDAEVKRYKEEIQQISTQQHAERTLTADKIKQLISQVGVLQRTNHAEAAQRELKHNCV
jgi:hypothetical protein